MSCFRSLKYLRMLCYINIKPVSANKPIKYTSPFFFHIGWLFWSSGLRNATPLRIFDPKLCMYVWQYAWVEACFTGLFEGWVKSWKAVLVWMFNEWKLVCTRLSHVSCTLCKATVFWSMQGLGFSSQPSSAEWHSQQGYGNLQSPNSPVFHLFLQHTFMPSSSPLPFVPYSSVPSTPQSPSSFTSLLNPLSSS